VTAATKPVIFALAATGPAAGGMPPVAATSPSQSQGERLAGAAAASTQPSTSPLPAGLPRFGSPPCRERAFVSAPVSDGGAARILPGYESVAPSTESCIWASIGNASCVTV
jgi:hypothetical protein